MVAWRELLARFPAFEPSTPHWPASAYATELRLPASYLVFMEVFGPGSLGDFIHLGPPAELSSRERIQLAHESGRIVIFAETDNGDALGWLASNLDRSTEPPVLRVLPDSLAAVPLADGFMPLLQSLAAGEDLFGLGPLPVTYRPMPPREREPQRTPMNPMWTPPSLPSRR